ncbi:DUF2165 domain-containing protein [Sphingomicrobium aestuariivivum]|uniref:DUF2165 domain-containing protein n=1 Tax=Sphingomicrobium aestuariivivum TaxID=1582356 RepID=UPI001FD71105|nr:DUF2165 domain-containing protein [Sphingomicrobium aestuariivivum]MCJ8190351.1 DUF2165 domain-containing protein [Sphingomicrobium aestuariivivum]
MTIRFVKLLLVIGAGLQALLYALQNIVNYEAGHAAVGYVLSRADHGVYPDSIVPMVTSDGLVTLAYVTIIAFELLGGLMVLAGAVRMAQSVGGTKRAFSASKWLALSGLGLLVFTWLGLFMAIGGAGFQMWQTEVGSGSLEGAFYYAAISGLVMALVAQEEPCWADRVEKVDHRDRGWQEPDAPQG